METTHRTQLYLDELQYQYLLYRAKSERKSMAAVVREIVERLIYSEAKRGNDPIYKIIGLGHSGKKDIGRHHDKYIYKKD